MRDIPTEAIQRVEILPEEVALKYGYRADQKVVNIVLRQRFRSTVAQLAGTTIPRSVDENLRPLRTFVAYASRKGDTETVKLFVQTS